MKFLLDMNLSPDWLAEFEHRHIEAVHWSQVGDIQAPDSAIMQYARENKFVVFTHDLDFGALLAATNASSPSVIQIRTQDITPQFLADKFFAVTAQFQEQLTDGALIIVDTHKNRVRLLPLKP
jgi:predicted nuclease of predicted toxin-antitoxin system